MASSSNSSVQKSFKYDVFISFRGEDTRKNFVDHLYHALKDKGIYTYKDDERIEQGKTIDNQLIQAIRGSRYFIIVFSQNYASSSWCLDELVEIMECQKTGEQIAYPVFFDVEPTHVRYQSGAFGKAFLENRNKDAAGKWIDALKGAAGLAGWELKNTLDGHEAKFIKKIVQQISLELRSINFSFDEKLVGMETRARDVISYLEIGIDEVRMIGIKGMGGAGKTTTARAVFDHLSVDFEATSFVDNVREVSNGSSSGLKNLQERVLSKVLNEHVSLDSVNDGKNMIKRRMCGIKVLLVLDDVDHIDQLEALAIGPNCFKPGSRILITTRDEQVLVAHGVNVIRDIALLSEQEAICLFSRYAFGRENPFQGYEELSEKVVRYADGLPLTIKVLGSFLCGKEKLEWQDAIDRLKKIPLKETQEKLELSYISLEDEYKEIFLDIACILKGESKEDAIRILESCGFHARIGLKVLGQRSLITISKDEVLGMHDHIEEMGKNIVRRSREPNEHSRLWIDEEIKDILANDKGTQETRCLKLDMRSGNVRILMKGLGKMKELGYLELNLYGDWDFDFERDDACLGKMKILRYLKLKVLGIIEQKRDEATQYFPNSLKYLRCSYYPFLYLPKTFDANNLVGLEMEGSFTMVQLWKERKKKVLIKLKFLSLSDSKLTTFDFGMTPNLESLSLQYSSELKELCMPVTCQKLKHLDISHSKLRTFDLGLTPNLETLSLLDCDHFVQLYVSAACPNLKILNLSKSRLRSLDLELLPNLEILEIENCGKLVEIKSRGRLEPKVSRSSATLALFGESIDSCPLHPNSNLPKLRFRYYDQNLPSSVGNIEKLISFGLCGCTDFKKFSDMICSLRCLNKLELNCSIPEFPKDLGQLECLEELCLSLTQITHLPDSICMLKRLKVLVTNCNLLEKLPEDLGQLECLEKLYVSSKKIEYLPDSICMLKHLKSLTANGDLLEKLPEDLGQLECLEELYVSSMKTEYLPDSICILKCLRSLDVTGCCRLGKLPEDLGQLECLEKLHVSGKKIEYLPDSICMLKRLKCLYVTDCCLGKLPEDIGQLESLERLSLWGTMIKHLPDSICKLKHLKFLNLSFCRLLEKLPEDLGRIECLENLDITYTGISHLPQSIFGLKGLCISASRQLLQLYDFPSEIKTVAQESSLLCFKG